MDSNNIDIVIFVKTCFKNVLLLYVCWMPFGYCDNMHLSHNGASIPQYRTSFIVGQNGEETTLISEIWQEGELPLRETTISTECMKHLIQFSTATSEFINCTVTNARPMHYCEKCVGNYVSVNNIYNVIFNDDSGTSNCKEQILRADNIQLVLLAHNFVKSIWTKSTCDNCFHISKPNGTKHYDFTQASRVLLDKINKTLDCFDDFSKLSKNGTTNATVCAKCGSLYKIAKKCYQQVQLDDKLCSDLIDAMNYTRIYWSGKYHCSVALPDKGLIWLVTALVCLLPILLYGGAMYYDRHLRRRALLVEDVTE